MPRIAWHVIDQMPTIKGQPLINYPGINIYRSIDWGYFPDPAVCLWTAVLPNKWEIVFKEKTWKRTLAGKVAAEIKAESYGFHVPETRCDATMFIKHGESDFSIGEIMENSGVPLTPSISRRDLLGYAIHDHLNTIIDGYPQLRIVRSCRDLIRTLPQIQMDPSDPSKMAEGEDHWVIALAFFCAGGAVPAPDPINDELPRWMRPKSRYPR